MMALAAPPLNDRKRVKVYELKNNDWYDRGTGFCAGQVLAVSRAAVKAQPLHWQCADMAASE
jgi:protein phosphatase-4 regulatory subunit 3